MKRDSGNIVWFKDVSSSDINTAGGKGANPGERIRPGASVPQGFIVTSAAYSEFLNKIKIVNFIKKLLIKLDSNDSKVLQNASHKIKEKITQAKMPEVISEEIKHAYRKMDGGLVAIRSSATAEDLTDASFAGQQRTFLNIQGEDNVLKAVRGWGITSISVTPDMIDKTREIIVSAEEKLALKR